MALRDGALVWVYLVLSPVLGRVSSDLAAGFDGWFYAEVSEDAWKAAMQRRFGGRRHG
jgi:hypothetical protein